MPASKTGITSSKKDQEEANIMVEVSTGHSYPSGGETSAIQGVHVSFRGLERARAGALLTFG